MQLKRRNVQVLADYRARHASDDGDAGVGEDEARAAVSEGAHMEAEGGAGALPSE